VNSLFVAWRPATPEQTGWTPVGRLEYDGQLYRFCYTRGARGWGLHHARLRLLWLGELLTGRSSFDDWGGGPLGSRIIEGQLPLVGLIRQAIGQ
jgi:hypothetical protein